MYRSSYGSRVRRPSGDRLIRCNFAIVAVLTILSTAMTAYIINLIANAPYRRADTSGHNSAEPKISPTTSDASEAHAYDSREVPGFRDRSDSMDTSDSHERLIVKPLTNNLSIFSSDFVANDGWRPVLPTEKSALLDDTSDIGVQLADKLRVFKQKLVTMNRDQLMKLLKALQLRIDSSSILVKKRDVVDRIDSASSSSVEPQKQVVAQQVAVGDKGVVIRSAKMDQLMGYLDKIESSVPQINTSKLEQLSAMNNEQSIVRIVQPSMMEILLKSEDAPTTAGLETTRIIRGTGSWQGDHTAAEVAPSSGWPQQDAQLEDWPTEKPTQRPKKRKRKRPSTTTTTTTTTTLAPETTTYIPPTTPAPPTAFEEVWIEEEEDIYKPPPRKRRKKYKKKTSAPPETKTTSTSTTTTTTTTTTPAPTTTTSEPVEDWPEEVWPEVSSTKSPNLWPQQKEEHEKWPEDEWLSAVRDRVERQIHVVFE